MSSKSVEKQIRKDTILSIVIDYYIKNVNPVGSSFIAKEYPLNVSSATIRNILAELEEEGYLTHPHTSAGRIPTQQGYRYYVDHLMHRIHLLEDEKMRIKLQYQQESLKLERLLEKTSKVISNVTQYTSIISVDGWDDRLIYSGTSFVVDYPDYHEDLKKISDILEALEEKEQLLEVLNQELRANIGVYIGQEIEYRRINSCSLVVSKYKHKGGASGRIAVLGPTRMDYKRVVCALGYFSDLIEELN